MASILRNTLQEQACEEINNMLAEIALLNKAITDQKKFTISVGGNRRSLMIDPAYNDKIVSILKIQRSKRIKDINAKAQKFRIGLSDEDKLLMGDLFKEPENPSESESTQAEEEIEASFPVAQDVELEDTDGSFDY